MNHLFGKNLGEDFCMGVGGLAPFVTSPGFWTLRNGYLLSDDDDNNDDNKDNHKDDLKVYHPEDP